MLLTLFYLLYTLDSMEYDMGESGGTWGICSCRSMIRWLECMWRCLLERLVAACRTMLRSHLSRGTFLLLLLLILLFHVKCWSARLYVYKSLHQNINACIIKKYFFFASFLSYNEYGLTWMPKMANLCASRHI